MKYFLLCLIMILSSCASTGTSRSVDKPLRKATYPRTLTSLETEVVKKGIRERLKDPNSAIFGNFIAAQESANHSWVCGTVNSKNSYGGYSGDQPFMGMLTHLKAGPKTLRMFSVSSFGGTEIQNSTVLIMCRRYGVLN